METNDSIYFYKEKENFGYMSNFYKVKFVDGIITFNCSEQYFMYHKCLLFDSTNIELLNDILQETSPTNIKKYGRQVKNFNQTVWNANKQKIMFNGLMLKFTQNQDIKLKLIATNHKMLYEASKYDKIWGIGFYPSDAIHIDKKLFGENLLGKTLMQVRSLITTL